MQVTEAERRAILSVADALIARAGRTTLVMALRGSRAKRVLQFDVQHQKGYGYFAGVPEQEVMARVDALFAARILRRDYHDDLPLLGYTPAGLALAEQYAADEWLEIVRAQVLALRNGAPFDLPFVHSKMPNRNLSTVGRLIELIGREADASWLLFLQAWKAVETKRVRGLLNPIIAELSGEALPTNPTSADPES